MALEQGQSPEEKKALDDYEQMWDRDYSYRRDNYERQMQINSAFYLGRQDIVWSASTGAVVDRVSPASRFTVIDNRIMPMVRAQISRQITKPGVQVLPEDTTHEARHKAKFKERVAEHIERVNDFTSLRQEISLWSNVCGDAFVLVDWDEAAGETYSDESGLYAQGEVSVRLATPWEIWEDAMGSCGSWGRHVWHGRIYPVQVANDMFEKERKKLGIKSFNDDASDFTVSYSRIGLHSVGNTIRPITSTDTSIEEDGVMVRKLYILKSKKYPQGKEVIIINGRLIKETPLKWFPVVHIKHKILFDRFRGDTEVREAIPLQIDRNKIRASISEYIHTMKGKWLVHKGTKISQSAITDRHGEKLFWEGGQPPTPISIPNMPSNVFDAIALNDQALEDLFANRPTSQGKSETGVESGVHASILAEEDDREHGPAAALYESSWAKIYKKCLDLAQIKYENGRVITTVGEDLEPYVETIAKEMLSGANEVYIITGSSLPKNKTVRAEMIRRDFAEGMYGDPADPRVRRKALKLRDAGIVDDIFDNDKLDEARAYEENRAIINSSTTQELIDKAVVVNDWDNDPIHIEVIERELKSTKFNEYSDHVKGALIFHWMGHMEKMEAMRQQMMQEQMAMGAGGGEGNPSGLGSLQGEPEVLQGAGGTQGGNDTTPFI